MSMLDEIVAHKREEIAQRKSEQPVEALREAAAARAAPPDFVAALRAAPVGLIAEVKRRSPSAGVIRHPFDPPGIARSYAAAGAQAVSVLMDGPYFGGGEDDFAAVRAAVELPLLYTEFVVDPWQVWHAAALGASAALLIAGVLDEAALRTFREELEAAGLAALVEVHDEPQMALAVASGATCIGINNRDLRTFSVSLETSLRVAAGAPDGCTLISESGIRGPDDVARLREAGLHGVLVGEHLLRASDLEAAVRDLMGTA